MKRISLLLLLAGLLLTAGLTAACDHLDDGDDTVVGRVLPGRWAFSYRIVGDGDPGFSLEYDQVTFGTDGTCSISYSGGALTGTYTATSSMIRIVSSDVGGSEQTLLWRLRELSEQEVMAEYEFTSNGTSFTAVVTLTRL